MKSKVWTFLLAAFLIFSGLIELIDLSFKGMDIVHGSLAVITGLFILINR